MKKKNHPKINKINANCSCGNIINIYSTLKKNITLDVCYACHPFYTGKQKTFNIKGRIELFNKRFNINKKKI